MKGPVDLAGDLLVAPSLIARGHELLVPQVDLGEIGESSLGEGPQQVERLLLPVGAGAIGFSSAKE